MCKSCYSIVVSPLTPINLVSEKYLRVCEAKRVNVHSIDISTCVICIKWLNCHKFVDHRTLIKETMRSACSYSVLMVRFDFFKVLHELSYTNYQNFYNASLVSYFSLSFISLSFISLNFISL